MKLIEIIREPCVLCPKTAGIVLESECQKCELFYGWNLGETKIGCKIPMPEPAGLERWVGLPVRLRASPHQEGLVIRCRLDPPGLLVVLDYSDDLGDPIWFSPDELESFGGELLIEEVKK